MRKWNETQDNMTKLEDIHYNALLNTLAIVFSHDDEKIELEKITINLDKATITTEKL